MTEYTVHIQRGTVTRNSDGVVVAPTGDIDSDSYRNYRAWAEAGNEPDIIDDPDYIDTYIISAADFRKRFTDAEIIGILTAARSGDIGCEILLLKLQTANEGIDLKSQETINGIQYLISKSLLTAQRGSEILSI